MRTVCLSSAIALLLASCGGDDETSHDQPSSPRAASAWQIGPVIDGKNYSIGEPLHPALVADGFAIDISPSQQPHYVTFVHGPLTGARQIVLRYRVEMADGVKIVPVKDAAAPSILALYIQRKGDDWSGTGKFEAFRWFAAFAMASPIEPGDHEIVAPLDADWTAVETSHARGNPAFADALANVDRIGFVLGGGDGLGHGVTANGPARIVVTRFEVQ